MDEQIKAKNGFNVFVLKTTLAVVVAQLVELSLWTPEIRSSNPNIGKILSTNCTFKYKGQKWRMRGRERLILKNTTLAYLNCVMMCL